MPIGRRNGRCLNFHQTAEMKLRRHSDRTSGAMIAQHLGVDLIDRRPMGYVGDIDGNAHEFIEPGASRLKDVAYVFQRLPGLRFYSNRNFGVAFRD